MKTGSSDQVEDPADTTMSAPREADANTLDEPAQPKLSRQAGTELYVWKSNRPYEAKATGVYRL